MFLKQNRTAFIVAEKAMLTTMLKQWNAVQHPC